MYISLSIYLSLSLYIYIYIYIYWLQHCETVLVLDHPTVGFHNFNLRIFNVRVSNPTKLIVDVFFDTMSDFNVPGSRPKKTR